MTPRESSAGAARFASSTHCLLDGRGVISWTDESWRAQRALLAGCSRPGENYLEACGELGAEPLQRQLRQLLHGAVARFEVVLTDAGEARDRALQVRGDAMTIDGARCALIAHQDVTELQAERRASESSEERHRQLLEAAPDAVFLLSAEPGETGRILDANSTAASMHGYTREELLRMRIADLDAPEDADLVATRVAELMRRGSLNFEVLHRHRDGREFPVEISARRATIDGRACIVTFNRDVSERRRYERQIAEDQLRLDLAARASRIGFWDWDLAKDKVQYSPEWKAQLGYRPEEIADDFEEWRARVHPEDLAPALAAIEAHIEGRTDIYETHFRLRHRDGDYRWIHVRGEASRDEHGKALRFFGCHIDVTEQRRAEAERAELAQRMSAVQRLEAIGTLAGGIAHDFNNILSIIAGNCELALLEADGPELVDSLSEIKKAGERARSLVRQILAFSRDETPERRPIDLAKTVREAVRLVRSTAPQRIRVESRIEAALPPVAADPEQLHQVLVNIGTNAWHAVEDGAGCVTFRTYTARLPDDVGDDDLARIDADYAVVEISDDGAGIDPEQLERIFEPFFTTKSPGHGTGLGLSVVHGIVSNHDGAIGVQSAVGAGTTFSIYLPPALERAADAPATPAAERAGNARVLLADDEPRLLHVLTRGLERAGFEVTSVCEPQRALETLEDESGSYDVFVTDLDMPGMDGVEAARRARALRAELPIVLCSGFMDAATQDRALDAGVDLVLGKPLLATELAKHLRELIGASPR